MNNHDTPSAVIEITDVKKQFRNFTLDIPSLCIPKGFATALIGENGAGKTTLLNVLAGVRLDYKGHIRYFEKWQDDDRDKPGTDVREDIGYISPDNYFLPHWTVRQVDKISRLLFDRFRPERYEQLCRELALNKDNKKVSELSDGNRMKLMLAAVLARDTRLLIMDEPASPLDPLMRERLCDLMHSYLDEGDGRNSILFSTHNISDMENVTDYAVILEHGNVVEQGFVEDLKEKYTLVKGDAEEADAACPYLYSFTGNRFGFEGLCLTEHLDQLAGLHVNTEAPTLSQISVAVLGQNTALQAGQ